MNLQSPNEFTIFFSHFLSDYKMGDGHTAWCEKPVNYFMYGKLVTAIHILTLGYCVHIQFMLVNQCKFYEKYRTTHND